MTKSELIDLIDKGSDIMFDVCGRHYTILTWCEKGINIGEHFCDEKDSRYYDTAEELVESFKVGDKTLAELASDVIITDYS